MTDILNLALLPFRGFALFNMMAAIVAVTGVFRIIWYITFSRK